MARKSDRIGQTNANTVKSSGDGTDRNEGNSRSRSSADSPVEYAQTNCCDGGKHNERHLNDKLIFRYSRAIEARRPVGSQLLHHSDRGCQYTSGAYQRTLKALGIECSMSRTGECYDNAAMERWSAVRLACPCAALDSGGRRLASSFFQKLAAFLLS